MPIASVNPATGRTLKTFRPDYPGDIARMLALAAAGFSHHRTTSYAQRASALMKAADILESEQVSFGTTMTEEMGKTLISARQEVVKCAWVCRFYAEQGEKFLADEPVSTNASKSYVRYEPLGPVLAVMPWNFPFWQVFRFAAPAIMAGNVGLLKHASNVPRCALAIEEIFLRAGCAPGVFQTLLVGSDQVPAILADERVKAVTLTGSEPAGSSVAETAGRLMKKTVLELGGSDPFIVMPSANLEEAAATAVKARIINNGQSCIAAKRFIVHERVADEFERRFVRGMEALVVGDPMDERTDLGPLATPEILTTLDEQVRRSVALGARVLTGAKRLDRPGNFYAPTVLADIPAEAPAYCDELFGPVASLFRVKDRAEAARLANDTPFGLASSVWTNDHEEAEFFIARIETGAVFVNAMVASDPRLPFGGVKHSGYGRELGAHGIREFVNAKTIWVR